MRDSNPHLLGGSQICYSLNTNIAYKNNIPVEIRTLITGSVDLGLNPLDDRNI